jgi:putative flippase GtrA
MTMSISIPAPLRRLVLYAVCGGSGVVLDFLIFSGLVALGLWYQAANIVGYASGTVLSFLLNRTITFGVRDNTLQRFASFLTVAGVGYLTSSAALWLLVEQAALDPTIAKAASLVIVLALQFTLNSLITFRQARKTSTGADS